MKKSTLIATCLLNSSMVTSLQLGEQIVRDAFDESFEGREFSDWDAPLPDKTAMSIINGVGRAMRINVRKFIADLDSIANEPEPDEGRSLGSTEEPAEPKGVAKAVQTMGKGSDGRT